MQTTPSDQTSQLPADGPGTSTVLANSTRETVVAVFALWETRYREHTTDFLSTEEVAALEIADVSESRAIYFLAVLREIDQGGAA